MIFLKKKTTILIFLFFVSILLFFNSCSVGGSYFFANESDKTIVFIQQFKDSNQRVSFYNGVENNSVLKEINDPELTIYGITNADRKFNRRTHKHLDPVPFQIDSVNQTVEIIVPPMKAIRFNAHHNFNFRYSKKIQLKIDGQIQEFEDLKLKYKTKGLGILTTVIKYKG